MRIVTVTGQLLASFTRYDIRTVALGEAWIREHGYRMLCIQIIQGITFVIVAKI